MELNNTGLGKSRGKHLRIELTEKIVKTIKHLLPETISFIMLSRLNMANLSGSNMTSKVSGTALEEETQLSFPVQVSLAINLIINIITCPFTVVLNTLVIMAVKRRRRLQSNANILLACLAATDAMNGLLVQSSFILSIIFKFLSMTAENTAFTFHNIALRGWFLCSSLHLLLITFERLIAIKFTIHYPYIVTKKNLKAAVIAFWIITPCSETSRFAINKTTIANLFAIFAVFSCVLFIAISYVLLYRETRRHERMIKAQQLPAEQVQRFAKDRKAFKTTIYVVGAVVVCFLPTAVFFLVSISGVLLRQSSLFLVYSPWFRTFGILNSLLDPLIYCWRQKEMRKFIFRFSAVQAVHPAN